MSDGKDVIENTENTEVKETAAEQPNTEMVENQSENTAEMVENKTSEPEITPLTEAERISAKHFNRINKEKEQLKLERDALLNKIKQQEQYQQSGQSQSIDTHVSPDDFNIDENNFAEGKDLKRIVNEMRDLKKELHQYKQKTALEVTEARLNAEHADFNKVFTDDNIELFKAEHPDIAESLLNSNADPYKVAKSMYKAMKQFGIYAEEPTKTVTKDRERVQANLSKPRPVASVTARQGNSPLSKAGEYADDELTEERKATLRAEVERYCR